MTQPAPADNWEITPKRGSTPAAVTVMLKVREAVSAVASCTWAVTLKLPEAVGVPEIRPALESGSPAGSAPEVSDHVYGGTPPAAAKACE